MCTKGIIQDSSNIPFIPRVVQHRWLKFNKSCGSHIAVVDWNKGKNGENFELFHKNGNLKGLNVFIKLLEVDIIF